MKDFFSYVWLVQLLKGRKEMWKPSLFIISIGEQELQHGCAFSVAQLRNVE